jgi:hypothetical protein
MAITKIMNIGAGKKGKITNHLKNALDYIMNEAKTESGVLVGGWNCVPNLAYEQMVGTKELYGKTGGRQGYHIVISCPPEEGTPEQLLELMKEFAQEFLGDDYEAVYSVHVDKEHNHGHLVFNSVNMNTGKKYEYKKGDWKYKIQPITNRLCEKHGLSIMPAEYSKDPVNMNRKQWEKEQSWSGFIEADVKYCRGVADDYEHFLYLLEELGYEVKKGAHLAVKAEKMKRFRRLDTINEEYSKENLEAFFAKGSFAFETPRVLTPDVKYLLKPKNPYQQKFYAKLYRMRVVEKCRFQYKSARFKEDLERMHMLQEEYLFLRRKDINGVADIVTKIGLIELDIKKLTEKQKTLYQERADLKRKCVTDNNILAFYTSEPEYRKHLEDIKLEKKKLQGEKHVAERCLKESLYVGLLVPENIEIGNIFEIDVPKKPRYLRKEESRVPEVIREVEVAAIVEEETVDSFDMNSFDMELEPDEIISSHNETIEDLEETKVFDVKGISMFDEIEMAVYGDVEPQMKVVTKEIYKSMTDKEKAEWIGIDGNDVYGSMKRFHEKMTSIGISYKYSSDETEEFCRLEEVCRKESDRSRFYRNTERSR